MGVQKRISWWLMKKLIYMKVQILDIRNMMTACYVISFYYVKTEKVVCCETMNLEEKQKVEEKFILNDVETSKKRSDQVDNIKKESEGISNPCENVDSEEIIMVVDEKYDLHEALNVSVKEHVFAKKHYNNLLCDIVLFGERNEEVDCCDENVDSEEKQKVDEMLILNEVENFDKKGDQVENMKQVLKGNSNSCEDEDLEETLIVVDENNDSHVALNVSVKEHLASEEHPVSLLCNTVLSDGNNEKVNSCGENLDLEHKQKVEKKFILNEVETSEEKGDQVVNMKQDSEGIFNPCENEDLDEKLTVVDDKIDSHEELNVSIKKKFSPEEHHDKLHYNTVLSSQNSEKVNCCDENAILEEKQNVEDKFILNGVETSEDKKDQVDITIFRGHIQSK
ncbi:uncharacterized protein LOC143633228 [Bidens hawaiensis]|uniref:uncharacterized protein LOC143633228 n=1 Tax=Bidens hawaiensis TaxID=980011 RepID=UPI00404AF6E6